MNKTNLLSAFMLLVIVTAIPIYGFSETRRMTYNQENMRQEYIQNAIELYLVNCSRCHGQSGEGVGIMPSLNRPSLREAQFDMLLRTIGRAAHGTTMAAWHIDEGGILTDYELAEIATLIKYGDWAEVTSTAGLGRYPSAPNPVNDANLTTLWAEVTNDPHQCIDCHEEPALHAEAFGINCARCHNTLKWIPAGLNYHNFALDHGGQGAVACATCHPVSYRSYDCYACHDDHQPEEMQSAHAAERIFEFADCHTCHPTGAAGEADRLRQVPEANSNAISDASLPVNLILHP